MVAAHGVLGAAGLLASTRMVAAILLSVQLHSQPVNRWLLHDRAAALTALTPMVAARTVLGEAALSASTLMVAAHAVLGAAALSASTLMVAARAYTLATPY